MEKVVSREMTSKYTFLLPAYKMKFLGASLASILGQTYSDFRVIVSDDASPEPLKDIVDKFHDFRVSYRRNENNMGAKNLVKHWNSLLNVCESEYVIIASDDDLYHPEFLQRINELINLYPNSDLFKTPAEIIDGEGQVKKSDIAHPEFLSHESFILHLTNPDSVLCIGNFVFRLSALKELGGFIDFPFGWKSDSATEIALATNGVPCASTILFSFRMSGLNISTHKGNDLAEDRGKLQALLAFHTWINDFLPQDLLSVVIPHIRFRHEGELRSYYRVLPPREFFPLYRRMVREGWFRTLRNGLAFLYKWLKSKK